MLLCSPGVTTVLPDAGRYSGVCAGAFDFSPINRPETIRDSAGVAAWFDETFAANLNQLQQLSGEQLARDIDFRGVLQRPAVHFLQVAQSHSIHHRGELATYLRPMGSKVPSIYGGSHDEPFVPPAETAA